MRGDSALMGNCLVSRAWQRFSNQLPTSDSSLLMAVSRPLTSPSMSSISSATFIH